jgi:hypothetical protein
VKRKCEQAYALGKSRRTAERQRVSARQSTTHWLFFRSAPLLLFLLIACEGAKALELRVTTFRADVTPPIGTPLCDALVQPAKEINDPLSARGIVLEADDERPVVLVAVDWVGIGNEGHDVWRASIATACGTTRDRVCVHALHQHDAPGCDFLAERIAAQAGLAGQEFSVEFAREAIRRVAAAAGDALAELEPVTQIGVGKARVEKVASNRRIVGLDGKVLHGRMTATRDAKVRAFPEGTIDPYVRLVSFWSADRPVAVLSYYATHPQSHYGKGSVSADYIGMARDERETADGAGLHLHFNGAGGNIGAGKFNDGSPENRPILASRVAEGMRVAWEATEKTDVDGLEFDWATRDVQLPLTEMFDEAARTAVMKDANLPLAQRVRASRDIAFAKRTKEGHKVTLARMRLGGVDILHMPGELFVEYQLAAQQLRPESFVCMAAYGDYGCGYIGTSAAYAEGGYETSDASRVSPRVESVLMGAVQELLE